MKGSSFSADSARPQAPFDQPLRRYGNCEVQKERKRASERIPDLNPIQVAFSCRTFLRMCITMEDFQVRVSSSPAWDPTAVQFSCPSSRTTPLWLDVVQRSAVCHGRGQCHPCGVQFDFGEDSITHPDIKVNYLDKQKVFRATRQEDGVGMQPFLDSYHALEFEVEVVEWPIEGSIVEFRRLTSGRQEPAPFRSLDSFVRGNYDAMRGVDNIHPLARLSGYVKSSGVGFFHSDEFADHLDLPEEQARLMLIRMTNAGYVDFNTASRECQVKPRLQRHIDARAGRIDYDVVAFNSNPRNSVTNATMSLGNRRLLLRGIGRFKLSEAQDVNIIPDKGLLSIGRNRNFEFDGTIQAGKFELEGTDFEFDYEAFKLEVKRAESLHSS